jgi:hypothetical protein
MPRAIDAAPMDKRTAAAGIDAYYEANLLMGEASSPSLEELTRRALKINEDGDRLFVHWTSPAAAIECQAIGPVRMQHCRPSRPRVLRFMPPQLDALPPQAAQRSNQMHAFWPHAYSSPLLTLRFARWTPCPAGDTLLLLALVVITRVVRGLLETLPLPRGRLSLCVLLVRARPRQHPHPVLMQAPTRRTPHVGWPGSAVQRPGVRLLGLSFGLAMRLVRRELRCPWDPLRDGPGPRRQRQACRVKPGRMVGGEAASRRSVRRRHAHELAALRR